MFRNPVQIDKKKKKLPVRMQMSIELDFVASATRWRSWLNHCATNQKVAGSISDGVYWNFSLIYTPGLTVTLGSTQPLTKNEYQEYLLGDKTG